MIDSLTECPDAYAAAPVALTVGGAFQLLGIEVEGSCQLTTSSLAACNPVPRLAKLKAIKVGTC